VINVSIKKYISTLLLVVSTGASANEEMYWKIQDYFHTFDTPSIYWNKDFKARLTTAWYECIIPSETFVSKKSFGWTATYKSGEPMCKFSAEENRYWPAYIVQSSDKYPNYKQHQGVDWDPKKGRLCIKDMGMKARCAKNVPVDAIQIVVREDVIDHENRALAAAEANNELITVTKPEVREIDVSAFGLAFGSRLADNRYELVEPINDDCREALYTTARQAKRKMAADPIGYEGVSDTTFHASKWGVDYKNRLTGGLYSVLVFGQQINICFAYFDDHLMDVWIDAAQLDQDVDSKLKSAVTLKYGQPIEKIRSDADLYLSDYWWDVGNEIRFHKKLRSSKVYRSEDWYFSYLTAREQFVSWAKRVDKDYLQFYREGIQSESPF
jgi:hypothetical protein